MIRSFASRSIRWRLALLSGGATFLVLCVFALVMGQLTASRIRSDFNNQLAAAVDDLRDHLQLEYKGGRLVVDNSISDYAAPNHAVIRVLWANTGRVIDETKNAPDFPLGTADRRTDEVGGYRVETRTFGRFVRLPNDLKQIGTIAVSVQYARRVSDVEATVHRVRLFLVLGVLAGTGLALALGLALSRRALAPISRLTATARDIEATRDPSRRVPVPDTADEVAELARTLDGMLQALEESRAGTAAMLDRQRQFVADASHELRTPLTSVLANLELLAEVLDGERAEAAQSALRSTQRMRRLVADLLLLARADARRRAPHALTDLSEVVVDAAAELGPMAEDHILTVDTDPATIDGARDELHRMALNLMQNALGHTPAGTHVRVTVGRSDGEVRLVVSDDGPGVPPELQDRIFERFVRGDGDRGGSTGLGLAIVRAVARTHGGDVRLESPPAGGARFVVTLPALGRAAGRRPEAGATAATA
ncbi:MAG TPA: HAMP domain-containing sensor histidine kinase [Baekduia sp.]|nr:HAMP domain-containing sensor histidine kinase [Baekduia sp.]